MHPKIQVLLSMLIFSTVGITVRFAELPSTVIVMGRAVLGTLFMLGFVYLTGKIINKASIRANAKVLVASGVALGLNWMLLFEAFSHTTIAVAVLCYYLAPVFLVLLSPLLGERLTGTKLTLSAIALMGMVFVSGVLKGSVSGGRGIAFAVAAAVLYTTVMFLNKKLGPISAYDKTVVQLFAAAGVVLPYCLLSGGFGMEQMAGKDYALLAVVGIVHTGIAYWLYFGALGRLPSQSVALFSYLDPVLAIVLSALWLGESIHWQEVLGAALILGSTLAGEITGKKVDKKG